MIENGPEDSLDNETGEKKTKIVCCNSVRGFQKTDAETGEPEILNLMVRRTNFQIPFKQLQPPLENRILKAMGGRKKNHGEFHLKKKIQSGLVKAILVSDEQNVSPFVFVLPTLLIFPAWASIILYLWEACMHIWSHKRNKKKKNRYTEYRSPLHLLSSQFCIHCRSRKWKETIIEIQKKRSLRRKKVKSGGVQRRHHLQN